jgi:hypothetical protein
MLEATKRQQCDDGSVRNVLRRAFFSDTSPLAAIVAATVALSVVLIWLAAPPGGGGPFVFTLLALACGIAVWITAGRERPEIRLGAIIYLLGLSFRLGSSAIFQMRGAARGDVFFATPDAVMYDRWARFLATEWRSGNLPTITEYYKAGSWEVGFQHVLGLTYLTFGESVLAGRVLVSLFGALAAVALFGVARRVVDTRTATGVSILYAIWPLSIGWASVSLLRDSLVWFLLLASVWLIFRLEHRRWADAAALVGAFTMLRFVRPYALYVVVAGLAVAAVILLAQRRREMLPTAILIVAVLGGTELFFVAAGYPSAAKTVVAYGIERWILTPIPHVEPVTEGGAPPAADVGPPPGETSSESPAVVTTTGDSPAAPPEPAPEPPPVAATAVGISPPSVPGNLVRITLAPYAWTWDVASPGNWQLAGMWLWYAVLPAAAFGLLVALRRPGPLAVIAVTGLALLIALALGGRGDAVRQREMVVPVILLLAGVGLRWASTRHLRILVAVYAAWVVILLGAMTYHRHSLRERGVIAETRASCVVFASDADANRSPDHRPLDRRS